MDATLSVELGNQEISGSRFKAILHVAFGIFLIALGWWVTMMPDTQRHAAWEFDIAGWGLIGVATLLLPEYIAAVFILPSLHMDAAGISIKMPLFRERRILWHDISEIYLHTGRGGRSVRWKYDQSGVPKGRIKLDGGLPKIWSEPPEVILAAMKKLWEKNRVMTHDIGGVSR